MKVTLEKGVHGALIRVFHNYREVAYVSLALEGLTAKVEFPSDWHERRAGWVRMGFGLFTVAFSFPWPWVVPDHGQCSGPAYGFVFFGDGLHLYWGKCRGKRDDPMKIISMPWRWQWKLTEELGEAEAHEYKYVLRSGEVQKCRATITPKRQRWTRWWLPFRRESRYIGIEFNHEVGEHSGSWKGGVLGCSYEMQPGETPLAALRRMERDRVFR